MLYEKILQLGKCSVIPTDNLTHEEWLSLRTTGIGGSDAGAICGLNKYSSPLVVYMAKKGITNFSGNKATEWGNILEDPIRQKAKEELEIEIEAIPAMFKSNEVDFINANLDGVVFIDGEKEIGGQLVSGLGGHEIKTSRNGEGFGENEIPDSYYCQVQHYMFVTGLPFFILTVFILDKREGRHYVVTRNDDFIKDLIQKEKDFWNDYVVKNEYPSPIGIESEDCLLDKISGNIENEDVELPIEVEEHFRRYKELANEIKELTQEQTKEKDLIKLSLYENSNISDDDENKQKIVIHCGDYKASYSWVERTTVDTIALKKSGLYEQYSKKSGSRTMRISEVK